ncbi:MAG TPA: hypothetical protein DCQ51_09255 [Planktothrix sp. UBA8407]|jgi:hypothetical protein|nr:hypothetical protein [Planktothrix sp. UBA8402]HAO11338.1 hypothetical protein [Planktothrix sp. UBA8407]HBK23225.1 hypothetical protein [Planktothrix sp. UBA10369]
MIISDLNYLEAVEGNVEGGYFLPSINQSFKVKFNVKAGVDISGNIAGSEAIATADGKNTLTQAVTLTQTTNNSSYSDATSLSGTVGGSYCWY